MWKWGTWTKDNKEIVLSASSDQTPSPTTGKATNAKETTQTLKTDLAKQKAIATHQNMEIEEILAINEQQRAEIEYLKEQLASLRKEVEAIKEELID